MITIVVVRSTVREIVCLCAGIRSSLTLLGRWKRGGDCPRREKLRDEAQWGQIRRAFRKLASGSHSFRVKLRQLGNCAKLLEGPE
jgi:hypothetical protein